MAAELFLAPDADGDPNLWGRDPDSPDTPVSLLGRRDVPDSWRDAVWNLLVSGLANAHDWELLTAQFDASQDLLEEAMVERAKADAVVASRRGLIAEADSLCSLILHRESSGLSEQTKRDLESLVVRLRDLGGV